MISRNGLHKLPIDQKWPGDVPLKTKNFSTHLVPEIYLLVSSRLLIIFIMVSRTRDWVQKQKWS